MKSGNFVGSFGADEDAFAGLARACDAALLDVNVGGAPIHPLAEALSGAGVPLVF
jgi:hypothetical protein